MSEKLGQISFERDRQPLFLPIAQAAGPGDYSEETSREIDTEVRRIIDEQHARAHQILAAQQGVLREAAAYLLGKEVITGEELKRIVAENGRQA
jgi:cell division protease FtsH